MPEKVHEVHVMVELEEKIAPPYCRAGRERTWGQARACSSTYRLATRAFREARSARRTAEERARTALGGGAGANGGNCTYRLAARAARTALGWGGRWCGRVRAAHVPAPCFL